MTKKTKEIQFPGSLKELAKKIKIFSAVNQKGGVGKTTLNLLAAKVFAYSGLRVLILDLDGQCTATQACIDLINDDTSATGFRIPEISDEEYDTQKQLFEEAGLTFHMDKAPTVLELFKKVPAGHQPNLYPRSTRFNDQLKELEGAVQGGKVDIVPGCPGLIEKIGKLIPSESDLERTINAARDIMWDEGFREYYDVVIIDIPPSITPSFAFAKGLWTDVIIPNKISQLENHAYKVMVGTLKQENLLRESQGLSVKVNNLGIMATMVDGRARKVLSEFYFHFPFSSPDHKLFDNRYESPSECLYMPHLSIFTTIFNKRTKSLITDTTAKNSSAREFLAEFSNILVDKLWGEDQ